MIRSRNSDRNRERRWHVAIPALFALGLLFSAVWSGNTALAIVALTVANIGICTVLPLFWSLPTALCGTAAAAGIALINSVGNLAGFVSPYLVGWLGHDRHHQHRPVHAGRLPGGRRAGGAGATRQELVKQTQSRGHGQIRPAHGNHIQATDGAKRLTSL